MENMAQKIAEMSAQLNSMAGEVVSSGVSTMAPQSFFITAITVLVLAAFLGYYVVWNVTPTLHSPLIIPLSPGYPFNKKFDTACKVPSTLSELSL